MTIKRFQTILVAFADIEQLASIGGPRRQSPSFDRLDHAAGVDPKNGKTRGLQLGNGEKPTVRTPDHRRSRDTRPVMAPVFDRLTENGAAIRALDPNDLKKAPTGRRCRHSTEGQRVTVRAPSWWTKRAG